MENNNKISLLFLLLLCISIHCEVSYNNLKSFWESAYDTDADGYANITDFMDFFHRMEHDHEPLELK
jgi:hypothetical protein